MTKGKLIVIGGGLAGCEAALQAANLGVEVRLYEMRPEKMTPAHQTGSLAELVCSNSLGTMQMDKAGGLLKEELRRLGCILLDCAEQSALPAGSALAIDRAKFSDTVAEKISNHPKIELIREEVVNIPPSPVIIASGPLTSDLLTREIKLLTGQERLFFFDAISPIVAAESINLQIVFRGSRYQVGKLEEGDYLNCPMTREQYENFVVEVNSATKFELNFQSEKWNQGVRAGRYFESCLPLEVIASRGLNALAYGPMRPVGLRDPRTGERPHAVVQLRQDNLAGDLFNLVGFQTNLIYAEQSRVFRLIPGLEKAEFFRYGQMHWNTFIESPSLLDPDLQLRGHPGIFLAGQLTGVEGYMGSIASGLLAGINAARWAAGNETIHLPGTTMLGALCRYITSADLVDFQPMKANFGILPALQPRVRDKGTRHKAFVERALAEINQVVAELGKQVEMYE